MRWYNYYAIRINGKYKIFKDRPFKKIDWYMYGAIGLESKTRYKAKKELDVKLQYHSLLKASQL